MRRIFEMKIFRDELADLFIERIVMNKPRFELNEWITPSLILTRTRRTMGAIHLDPASSETANLVVRAENIFTKEEDPINKAFWTKEPANVFINPPVGNGNHEVMPLNLLFWAKAITLMQQGMITQLTFFLADIDFLPRLYFPKYPTGVCLLRHQIMFLHEQEDSPKEYRTIPCPSAVIYVANQNLEEKEKEDKLAIFVNNFSDIGNILLS